MAYPQRAPQQRPPPARQYDNRYPQAAGWQGPPQNDYYDQGYQDYGYDNYDGYGDAGYSQGSNSGGQQAYPPARSQSQQQRGGYGGPQDNRQYNRYDGGPPNQSGYNDRGYPGGRRPPPGGRGGRPMNRPPPQQGRMRPPPERRNGPPEAGIERQMAGMDLKDRSPPGRAPERPHTSHSSRSDSSRQQSNQSSPQNYRNARDAYGRDMGQRGPPPSGYGPPNPAPGRPERPYVDTNAPPAMPQAKRSATMPVNSPTQSGPPRKPQYPGQSTYQEPTSYSADPQSQPPPPRPSTTTGFRPADPSNIHRSNTEPYPSHHPSHDSVAAYASQEFLEHYFQSPEGDEPDMPNFDAIPENPSSHPEHLIPGVEEPKYAAYKPEFAAQAHQAQSQPDVRGDNQAGQFANAGFQFDLPNNAPPGSMMPPQNGYGDPMNSQYPPPGRQGPPMAMYPEDNGGYGSPPQQYGGPMQHNGPPQPYRVNQPGAMESQGPQGDPQNPDSLPVHPTPFRPGLDSKPAPVRQYDNSPAGPAGPAGPSQGPPQDAPREDPDSPPVTKQEIERLQLAVRSKPDDQKMQLTLAKKMVEASTVLVADLDAKSKNKAREKYILDAHKIVKKLVHGGYTEAMFYLADCYGQGQLGLEVDTKEAFHLYQSAAKQGHAESAYRVAVCCELGQEEGGGTKRDPFKAVQWYKRAAALGNTPAMYKMGMILLKGLLGQQKSPREAVSWLKRAAERADEENPHALHELALLYESAGGNDVIIRDEEYSRQLFHQAAELGYKFSQFRLGSAYEYGLMGCPVDARQSIVWYTRAAAQGEHQSELALSGWYLTGAEGILQQSDTEAYLWARKAASAGLAKAEYAMGYFTEVGIGVVSNLDDAKRWYWRAASQNFDKARERLEDLKKGGGRIQKARVSRSNVSKQNEGDCVVM